MTATCTTIKTPNREVRKTASAATGICTLVARFIRTTLRFATEKHGSSTKCTRFSHKCHNLWFVQPWEYWILKKYPCDSYTYLSIFGKYIFIYVFCIIEQSAFFNVQMNTDEDMVWVI